MAKIIMKVGIAVGAGAILYTLGACAMAGVYMYKGIATACGDDAGKEFAKASMKLGYDAIWNKQAS